jgi:diacylglycerol kinase family enzyme
MTSGEPGAARPGAAPRWWAAAALGSLLAMLAGLVLVVVGSRRGLLQLLVGTVLSVAVLAAAAWWAFTTRRVWKRRLYLGIAVLAVANVALGLLEFGVEQAVAALAIVAGALGYATAAGHALRPPAGRARAGRRPGPAGTAATAGASRPWLLVNPRSGGGKAGRAGLVEAARARGVAVHELVEGDDPVALARAAVAGGADALGVAGGDGSLGLVAAVAVEAGLPFVCVPVGTRNHFAGDLGLDRADPLAALDAFAGVERRIDVGVVGERVFVNNVSLGAYADLVADPRYRAAKLATAHAVLPPSLRGERPLLQVGLVDADGRRHPDVLVLLVASNRYEADGGRERLDAGVLQVSALRARSGAAFAGLAARSLAARVRLAAGGGGWAQWTTTSLLVEAPGPEVPAGIDGEAATLASPLRFRVLPLALRVLLPPEVAAASRVRLQRWSTVRRLAGVALGRP